MLEQTITQNSALYLAQHKVQKQRTAPFSLRAVERDRRLDLRKPAFSEAHITPRFFRDYAH